MILSQTFVNAFANSDPKIEILIFLYSAQAMLLKPYKTPFKRWYGDLNFYVWLRGYMVLVIKKLTQSSFAGAGLSLAINIASDLK